MAKGTTFQDHLKYELLDPDFAAAYLAAALEEGEEKFLSEALSDVVKVHGAAKVASEMGIARQAIYQMIGGNGNPSFRNVVKLLSSVGLEITIQAKKVG